MKNFSVFSQLSVVSTISFWQSFGAFKTWIVTEGFWFFFYGMHGTNSERHFVKKIYSLES